MISGVWVIKKKPYLLGWWISWYAKQRPKFWRLGVVWEDGIVNINPSKIEDKQKTKAKKEKKRLGINYTNPRSEMIGGIYGRGDDQEEGKENLMQLAKHDIEQTKIQLICLDKGT